MSLSAAFNGITLSASLIALITSISFAFRQSRLMRHANQLPVIIGLFDEFRSPTFIHDERRLWDSLHAEADPQHGFEGMPEALSDAAYNVCWHYQLVAYLVAFDMIDERLAVLPHHYRIIKTWSAVQPYIEGERAIRGGEYTFLNFFEDFALMCQRVALDDIYLNARKHKFGNRRGRGIGRLAGKPLPHASGPLGAATKTTPHDN